MPRFSWVVRLRGDPPNKAISLRPLQGMLGGLQRALSVSSGEGKTLCIRVKGKIPHFREVDRWECKPVYQLWKGTEL